MTECSSYLFDNASSDAATRFAGLEAALDPTTFRHLRDRGVSSGWMCLEVGAGGGSIVRWLAKQVGPSGAVVATDLNLSWVAETLATNVELRVHDIVRDPVENGSYDLVHARLVLLHLSQRNAVIEKLISALKLGAWLVLEEFTPVFPGPIPDAETEEEHRVNRVYEGVRQLLSRSGADTQVYPRSLVRRFHSCGLTEVGAEGTVVFGGPAVGEVIRANVQQVSNQLVGAGVSSEDIAAALRTINDAQHLLALPMLISAWGRKP
jgi:SAM-dependent methyltransferase